MTGDGFNVSIKAIEAYYYVMMIVVFSILRQ